MLLLKKLLGITALSILMLAGCGSPPEEVNYELELLREIQAELAELRAENNELRESNALLIQSIEDLQQPNEADDGVAEEAPVPEPAPAVNEPIVVEIHVIEPSPEPSPIPSPTPEPATLYGRWVTIGAIQNGILVAVPPEQSFEIELNSNGTGTMVIEGIGSVFTWTGGDTGEIGRLVITFTEHFGYGSTTETMTYAITGTNMGLTHTMFDSLMTTTMRKAG